MRYFVLLALVAGLSPLVARTSSPAADSEAAYRANNIGVALLEQYEYDGAAKSFREALQLAPDLAAAHLNLAIALLYGAHLPEAATEAKIAVERLPDSPTASFVAGLIAKGENNLDEAMAAFQRVLQLDPSDAGTKIHLGQIYLQQRRYDEALKLFQEALQAEPYNVTAAYSAALALTRGGKPDEGREAMKRFETLRDSPYGVTFAQTYLAQGRYGEAMASTGAEPGLVNPATPSVSFVDATDAFLPPGGAAQNADPAGGVMLADIDADGHLDVIAAGAPGVRLLRNDGKRLSDDTARAGVGNVGRAAGVVAGDDDNDGKVDLFVLRGDGDRLLHQKPDGTFEDVTSASGIGPSKAADAAAAFVDVDHDGDLDIVTAGASARLLRNNGNGTFTDITAEAGFAAAPGRTVGIVPTDFDNRRDIDVLLAGADRGASLFRNMRDGTFRESAEAVGLPAGTPLSAAAVGDVNKDGYPDFFFGKAEAPGVLAVSDGHAKFRTSPAPDATRGAVAALFVDYDDDGLPDLVTMTDRGLHLFRAIGADRWSDATDAAQLTKLVPAAGGSFQSIAAGDLDADGDTDLVVRDTSGRLHVWRNEGGNRNASLGVRLAARVSNRSGLGAKVELRAGSLRAMMETSSAFPSAAPADIVFGLGSRTAADVVRVLWPSGILQAETALPAPAAGRGQTFVVTELDRKPSSCPYLFTWNGTRFEFVTDFMGGGEMGDWVSPSAWNTPDPDEYVRIRGDQLVPRNGRYELRVTNELEETLFMDRVQLVAIDHPSDDEVYPNEGLKGTPPPFALTAVRDVHPLAAAVDEHGHDVLPSLSALDRRYAGDFGLLAIRGYAEPHELTLDLGALPPHPVLLMTGWTDYAFSNDNVAASQRAMEMAPPSLDVRDSSGAWRTAIADVGFPVGRPQTIVVDLANVWRSSSRQVRIRTNMRIYWDQISVASAPVASASVASAFRRKLLITRLDPLSADLHWRGFSEEVSPDRREPFGYDYDRVTAMSPWKVMAGRYTREGDVRALLDRTDDMFVISKPGDEIALSFDALPPLREGWSRTFLLYANGYSKEMNPRSARPDTVGPLPFHRMTRYPYGPDEHYPHTNAHLDYLERYNTRVVTRTVPSVDAALAALKGYGPPHEKGSREH
jgi:cytochrome c-type biogenesis protein CcmH/NrfG